MSEQAWPQEIVDAQFIRLTTFRRSGVAVATTVWFVVDADALLVTTMDSTGKAKRLRHTSRVTLSVCDRRGKLKGLEYEGNRRVVARRSRHRHPAAGHQAVQVRGPDTAVVDCRSRLGAQLNRPDAGGNPDSP